jgi:uncharacterized protein YecE (DUF72 family)
VRGTIRIATAGWAIPRRVADKFLESGSALERYAARFDAVEINSTFHQSHKPPTYARWMAAVPEQFKFAVKVPKTITHERRLVDVEDLIDGFLDEVRSFGPRLGPLLIQLPPSLGFDAPVVKPFLDLLRARTEGALACEPRHPSWFQADADHLLVDYRVARVAADPARVPEAAVPGGWDGLAYVRLHGSPRIYCSEYEPPFLAHLAAQLRGVAAAETWCVFDNTASGAALGNALDLMDQVRNSSVQRR